jgi:hypothetical protein
MKKNKSIAQAWFFVGILSAATLGAFANIPGSGNTVGTMAPTQDVSEIRAKRHSDLSFDQDLRNLSAVQGRYRENISSTSRKQAPRKTSTKKVTQLRSKITRR